MTNEEVIKAAQRNAFEQARAWLRRPYVRALALGMRKRREKYVDEPCVVVTIDKKLLPEALAAAGRRPFPLELETRVGSRKVLVPVDVQTSDEEVGRLFGLPGKQIFIDQQHRGTVAFVVTNARGEQYLLTAAHVVMAWLEAGTNPECQMGDVRAYVHKRAWGRYFDQALLEPTAILDNGLLALPTGTFVAGVKRQEELSTNDPCKVFRAGASGFTPTTIRDTSAEAPFEEPWTGKVVWRSGLIAVDACAADGDSGTALLTEAWLAIGTLVGTLGDKNYFCPCWDILEKWGVSP